MGLLGGLFGAITYMVLLGLASYGLECLWSYSGQYTRDGHPDARIQFPNSIPETKALGEVLRKEYFHHLYSKYSVAIFSAGYIFKQTFSKCGSVYLTILSPLVYGGIQGWILCSFLQAVGSCGAYILAKAIFCPALCTVLGSKPKIVKDEKNEKTRDRATLFKMARTIVGARLFPLMPNFIINFVAASLNVPLWLFFLATFVGSLPNTFCFVYFCPDILQFNNFVDIFWLDFRCLGVFVDAFVVGFLIMDPIPFIMEYFKKQKDEQWIMEVERQQKNDSAKMRRPRRQPLRKHYRHY